MSIANTSTLLTILSFTKYLDVKINTYNKIIKIVHTILLYTNSKGMRSINLPMTKVLIVAIKPPLNANKAPRLLFNLIYCSNRLYNEGRVDEYPAPISAHALQINTKLIMLSIIKYTF